MGRADIKASSKAKIEAARASSFVKGKGQGGGVGQSWVSSPDRSLAPPGVHHGQGIGGSSTGLHGSPSRRKTPKDAKDEQGLMDAEAKARKRAVEDAAQGR